MKRTRQEMNAITNEILEVIRAKPTKRWQILKAFPYDENEIDKFIARLHKKGLIKREYESENMASKSAIWVRTNDNKPYSHMLKSEIKAAENKIIGRPEVVKFSPYANPNMCVTANRHHTTGNKHKLSAWSGYSSIGGL